ncbi:S49 family peptidase, partial [Puniceibacterium confluentis]|uniref:S49 family peptidase n=1 Tax=Puniceibacterium confluentis TaxID=1958944 RepID=UPI003562CB24
KPVWAFVSDHAFSAGYAIASQADHIVLPRTGGVGSIGVICMHADYKDQLEMMGVKVTVISAGERKADGNPYEPLPESVRNDLQAEMEQLRLIFAATVAEGRGELLDTEAALATEAASFIGAAAVTVGLADEVANPRDAFERFVAQVNGRAGATATTATRREGSTMSDQTTTPKPKGTATPAQAAPATLPTASESPAAPPVAENPAPAAAAGPGTSGSAADERVRISAILSHPDAKGREDLAQSLAFNSTMSAEEAAVHLKAAPQQAASRSLSASMEAEATELDAPGADADKGAPSMAARMKERFAN